jgi:hypothetical protein
MRFCHFFLFSDHCAVLELGYLKSGNSRLSVAGQVPNIPDKRSSTVYKLYDELDLAKYIKINRLKWAGHVIRMDNNWITKRMFNTRPEGKRGFGRPKLRWGG